MSDASIKTISGVRQIVTSAMYGTLAAHQAEASVQPKPAAASQENHQSQAANTPIQTGNLANVSIHFRVDESTNDVTIFIVDRQSKKVLRSIPASELSKLQVGDLLKLTG